MVEDIENNDRLLHKLSVRHEYVDGRLKSLPADTPLSQEWLDEHSEQVEIMAYRGAKILDHLLYTLRW